MKKSRKKRAIVKWAPFPEDDVPPLERAESCLRYAHNMLAAPRNYQGEEWSLLAGLIGKAAGAIREAQAVDRSVHLPLFDTVMEEFRDATANFTKVEFLRSTRAARRDFRDFYRGLVSGSP